MDERITVFVNDGSWHLACVTGDRAQVLSVETADGAQTQAKAQASAAMIVERGGGPVVVALPSHWCLSAVINTHDLSRSNRRQALRYLLEEELPVSAEDAVADFVEHQDAALGVAAELERLQPIVEAFEDAGVSVKSICPAAMLAAADCLDACPQASAIVLKVENGFDLIEIDRMTPSRWWWLSDESALRDRLAALRALDSETTGQLVTPGGIDAVEGFETVVAQASDPQDNSAEHHAARHAAKLLAGEVSAWIDLRRDALQAPDRYQRYQKQAGMLAAALVFFLACVIGATFWRGQQYQAHADEHVAQQIGVYKQVMPGQRVPASIISRLQSEQRRLAGLGGQTGPGDTQDGDALHPISALSQLHTVLTAWPASLRYRVSDLTIEPNLVRINGQAADSVTPEKLAAALRASGRYEVDPPNTRALSDYGFSFGFIARPITADSRSQTTPPEPDL